MQEPPRTAKNEMNGIYLEILQEIFSTSSISHGDIPPFSPCQVRQILFWCKTFVFPYYNPFGAVRRNRRNLYPSMDAFARWPPRQGGASPHKHESIFRKTSSIMNGAKEFDTSQTSVTESPKIFQSFLPFFYACVVFLSFPLLGQEFQKLNSSSPRTKIRSHF